MCEASFSRLHFLLGASASDAREHLFLAAWLLRDQYLMRMSKRFYHRMLYLRYEASSSRFIGNNTLAWLLIAHRFDRIFVTHRNAMESTEREREREAHVHGTVSRVGRIKQVHDVDERHSAPHISHWGMIDMTECERF